MSRAVAISGAGCLCAAGLTLEASLQAMLDGHRAPAPPVAFSTSHPEPVPVFEILAPLPAPGSDEDLLRTTRLAISAAMAALDNAGLDPETMAGKKVGVCIGTTVGSAMNNEAFYRDFRDGKDPSLAPIERYLRSNPASAVARHFSLDGPCQVVVNACSSGTDAIGIGASWIRSGVCDIVLAGGADELCRTTSNGFASLMITAPEPCRPFDVDRKGLNLGEGAAVLVLESESSRNQRQHRQRGYVLGYGSATDAYHLTAPHPDGVGLKQAVAEALSTAGLSHAQMAFINAHGTGTPDNDKVEGNVMAELFAKVPFVSTKCYTGHTLGAAGAIEAALTLACLEQGRIPGNAGFVQQDPAIPACPVAQTTSVEGNYALSESLAFGGNNAALVLGLEVPQ